MKENYSKNDYNELFSQYEKFGKVSENAMKNFVNNADIRPTDWRILLPRAFYMNWSDRQTWLKSFMDPTIWFPLAFYPEEENQ